MSFNNVKTLYFIKVLFSYLNEKRKLKIINYNKSLQNLLDINIINYKIFSGKFLEYESGGNVKEYDSYNDHLIYEGEYLNGKRNGKGKEYFPNKGLKFEGEYLNGKRNGKGKEYFHNKELKVKEEYLEEKNMDGKGEEYFDNKELEFEEDISLDELSLDGKGEKYFDDQKLKFEGEYLNGKKWNGKGYDRNGIILYELKNGNGDGFIKDYDDYYEDLVFEGEYKNGEKNGKGILSGEYGIIFDGEFLNGKMWNGKLYDEGDIICELKGGKGIRKEYSRNDNILRYEGEYLNGELNGKVRKFDYKGKLIFEGEYIIGKLNGKVKKYDDYDDEGKIKFEGEYLYDHKRKGKEYIDGRLEYEGEYLFDKKWNGKGYDKNGNIIYELINGNGKVKEYNEFGELKFEGEYLNGKKNGKGKEYNEAGFPIFEREYLDGKICKEINIEPNLDVSFL